MNVIPLMQAALKVNMKLLFILHLVSQLMVSLNLGPDAKLNIS